MYDLISILLDYVEALPPTPDMDRVSEESFPFLQRLYQLTGEDEADRIWGAAMEVGASEGRQMLLTGLALGLNLWNALVIGVLGLPGFVLLLLAQWVL